MADFNSSNEYPEGVISFLDTDLYKLTMQCAVFKYYRDVPVSYAFTNRTPDKKLSRKAFAWLTEQISKLGNISLSDGEYEFLKSKCKFLAPAYVEFLRDFRLHPREQIVSAFKAVPCDAAAGSEDELGEIDIQIKGKWVDTILYEIPLLALTSEAYFKFMETDWDYKDQLEKAYQKGLRLLESGCITSEFGTRRRRDYHTQALVIRGLVKASEEGAKRNYPGKLSGTSNVHLAWRFKLEPVGTVAHEWFMGIAAINNDYLNANEEALRHWVGCFGEGVLGIALTDTFGTDAFLQAFGKPVRLLPDTPGQAASGDATSTSKLYADIFAGVRQDSGDPATFVERMWVFFKRLEIERRIKASGATSVDPKQVEEELAKKEKIAHPKTIVFSDSLNIDKCIEYKAVSDKWGFNPTFGVGTYLSNDFTLLSTGEKSAPLNIVIKLSSAGGNPAIKISDNVGKNTGDKDKVAEVKKLLHYEQQDWAGGDEAHRW